MHDYWLAVQETDSGDTHAKVPLLSDEERQTVELGQPLLLSGQRSANSVSKRQRSV